MDWPDCLRDQAAKYRQLAEQLTILPSKTRCLSWRPCVKRSPIISRTILQAGNWSRASPVKCEGRAIAGKAIKGE